MTCDQNQVYVDIFLVGFIFLCFVFIRRRERKRTQYLEARLAEALKDITILSMLNEKDADKEKSTG